MGYERHDGAGDPFSNFLSQNPVAARRTLKLIAEGRELLDAGKIQRAQRKFHQALNLCPTAVSARTNLALTYLMQGDYQHAVAQAETALRDYPGNVFALCTLVECYVYQGQPNRAQEVARRAVRAFRQARLNGEATPDDLVKLVEALADLGDHQRLYHLYTGHVRGTLRGWDGLTLARLGVAAFNVGRLQEARWLWRSARGDKVLEAMMDVFLGALQLVEDGKIPCFPMDYSFGLNEDDPESTDPPGFIKAFAVHSLWYGDDLEAREAALDLLSQTDQPWAADFLFMLVRDPDLPDSLKMKAGGWLLERGFLDHDTPVEMYIEGHVQEVIIAAEPVPDIPPAVLEQFQKGLEARERGASSDAERAYRKALLVREDFVPALINLANLCRQQGRYNEAENLLSKALSAEPDQPLVAFNLAALLAERGQERRAAALMQQVRVEDMPAEAQPLFYALQGQLFLWRGEYNRAARSFRRGLRLAPSHEGLHQGLETAREYAADTVSEFRRRTAEEARRQRYEQVPIEPHMAWEQALQRLTKPRLSAMAKGLGLKGVSGLRKGELCRRIARALRTHLADLWERLADVERQAVRWLAAQGGVASYRRLRLKFGPDHEDTVDWDRMAPASIPMRLQYVGLAFAGSMERNGTQEAVVVIPEEALRRLHELWAGSRSR